MSRKKKTTVAIMYDFDKTLCTTDMQNYELIPNLGIKKDKFWEDTTRQAEQPPMDRVLAYMYTILRSSQAARQPIRRENFMEFGKTIEFFKGVDTWFERINNYGKDNEIIIEHYVISSGLKEIIEGTAIKKYFKRIYACEFLYDENGAACWPALAVNFTGKTQFLYRINKQCLNVNDDKGINKYTPEEDRPIPFRNMIYIGDGITDVPCMKLVKTNGGYSIGVYPKRKPATCKSLIAEKRVDFIFAADYSEGSELEQYIKDIILKMGLTDKLVKTSYKQELDCEC